MPIAELIRLTYRVARHPAAIAVRLRITWSNYFVCRFLVRLLLIGALVSAASGSGPRFVTGPPFFTGQAGVPIGWRQPNLTYFTDPGDLSASVNHQAADALVAAAAGVWNLPVASITIAQGGELTEHVSAQNTYMGANGMVFPADVMSTNAVAIPIAIIYDSDGSVTENLLGAGSSDPSECAQDAVTESVDAFDPQGYILHAVIVLNGRCTSAVAGGAPQQQLQMQYQLMRVFGRVLGLAWSQTNDNVFTGSPTPTYGEELNWPVMHPIDIICGSYSYQCMANPFQLRPDDVASMVAVYPIAQNATPGAGKQSSWNNATGLTGAIFFPSGQGMEGVNVLIRRQAANAVNDGWYEVSGVTGAMFRRAAVSPFVSAGTDALSSMGTNDQNWPGYYSIAYIPMEANQTALDMQVTLEAINPLYAGVHSLGPYEPGNVSLPGMDLAPPPIYGAQEGGVGSQQWTVADAPTACGNGTDGTLSVPMELPPTGWWTGLLCGYGHASYIAAGVKPGRTFTVEVTALDQQGNPTTTKAMPVIGIFQPGDASTPSLALAATAFQAWGVGTTTVSASTGQLANVTVGIADQRGDGRPDFAYQSRFFYADSVTPSTIATAGATITISGSGFRNGNAVSINGIAVNVISWSASTIVVTAPAMSVVGASNQSPVDVVVQDRTTGATTTMTAALTYDSSVGLPNAMRVVSIPTASAFVGNATAVPFTVQVIAPDGVTPVAGDTVVFSVPAGAAQYGDCAAIPCSVRTDANGMASRNVTPTTSGTVTLQATDGALTQGGSFLAEAQVGSIVVDSAPAGSINVGVQAQNVLQVTVLAANGNTLSNEPVTFSVPVGGATFSGCNSSTCTVMTDSGGNAWLWVTPASIGTVTIKAAVGNVSQQVSFTGASNVDVMQIVNPLSQSTWVNTVAGNFAVRLLHPDGTPDGGEPITFSAPVGVKFDLCETNVCTLSTDGGGNSGLVVTGLVPGTYTIRAAFGAVLQTTTFTVSAHTYQMNLISSPANNATAYVSAPIPFAVQVMEDGTTPAAGASVELTGVLGDMVYDLCGQRDCLLTTDANGMASTTVTPLVAGTIVLNAVYNSQTITTSFTALGVVESLHIFVQPPPSGLLMGVSQQLAVQLIGADGVTPLANHRLYFTVISGPFAFTSCTAAVCLAGTDTAGNAGITGMAYGTGPVIVQVTDSNGPATLLIQFNAIALPDVLKLVSAPASGGYAGFAAPIPFGVQALFNDGVTPVSGRLVTVSVTNGQASLVACAGASTCVLTADANGMISTLVTPLSTSPITITATDGGVTISSSFTAIPKPDILSILSAPANGSWVGVAAAPAFSLRLLQGDGITPDAGKTITISAIGAVFGACAASSCSLVTNATGLASTAITPAAAGSVTLTATVNGLTATDTFTAVDRPNQLALTSQNVTVFVAEGAIVPLTLSVQAVENGIAAPGQPVHWTQATGYALAASDTLTDASGATSVAATLGPLAGGVQASATACAWTSICVAFNATGVPAASQQAVILSGAQQSATGGVAFTPLVLQVVDTAGHAVAGAAVSIYQTVTALDAACPAQGRCPAAPILASNAQVVNSADDGTVTFTPLGLAGVAVQTEIAISVGTQGYATTVLTSHP